MTEKKYIMLRTTYDERKKRGMCVECEKPTVNGTIRCALHLLIQRTIKRYTDSLIAIPLCHKCKTVRVYNHAVENTCRGCQHGYSVKKVRALKRNMQKYDRKRR